MDIKPSSAPGQTAPTGAAGESTTISGSQPVVIARILSASPAQIPQQLAAGAAQTTLFDVVIDVAGKQVTTQSNIALTAGQTLKVQVQSDALIRIIELPTQSHSKAEQPSQQGLRQSLPLQQNPKVAIDNLGLLTKALLDTGRINQQQLLQLQSLIDVLPNPAKLVSPNGVKNALLNSGVFLEHKLATILERVLSSNGGAAARNTHLSQQLSSLTNKTVSDLLTPGLARSESSQSTPTQLATAKPTYANATNTQAHTNAPHTVRSELQQALSQDLKTQLMVTIRNIASLSTQTQTTSTTTPQLGQLDPLAQIVNRILATPSSPSQLTTQADSTSRQFDTRLNFGAPPQIEFAALLNQSLAPTDAQRLPGREAQFDLAISTLLRQLAASLAKIHTDQFSQLTGQRVAADGTFLQNLSLEIPVYSHGEYRPIQLQLEEYEGQGDSNSTDSARQWKITLGFDLASLGEFYATLRVLGNSVSTTFWSESDSTLHFLDRELEVLTASLNELGLDVTQIQCQKGTPPLTKSRLDQQLVDIKT